MYSLLAYMTDTKKCVRFYRLLALQVRYSIYLSIFYERGLFLPRRSFRYCDTSSRFFLESIQGLCRVFFLNIFSFFFTITVLLLFSFFFFWFFYLLRDGFIFIFFIVIITMKILLDTAAWRDSNSSLVACCRTAREPWTMTSFFFLRRGRPNVWTTVYTHENASGSMTYIRDSRRLVTNTRVSRASSPIKFDQLNLSWAFSLSFSSLPS